MRNALSKCFPKRDTAAKSSHDQANADLVLLSGGMTFGKNSTQDKLVAPIDLALTDALKNLEELCRQGLNDKNTKTANELLKVALRREKKFPELWTAIQKRQSKKLSGSNGWWGSNRSTAEVGFCKISLPMCISSISDLAIGGSFASSLRLCDLTSKIIMSLYFASQLDDFGTLFQVKDDTKDKTFEEYKRDLIERVKQARLRVKSSSVSEERSLPICALIYSLSLLEIGVHALHDPKSVNKLLMGVGLLLKDVVTSVGTLKLETKIFTHAVNLAKTSAEMIKERNAASAFEIIASLEYQKECIIQNPNISTDNGFAILTTLAKLEKRVKEDRRWEISAAFSDVLAALILDDRSQKHALKSDFAIKIICGDAATEFGGLRALVSIGDPPALKDSMTGAGMIQVVLRNWASDVCEGIKRAVLSDDALQSGIDILVSELNSVCEILKEKMRTALDPATLFSKAMQDVFLNGLILTGVSKDMKNMKNKVEEAVTETIQVEAFTILNNKAEALTEACEANIRHLSTTVHSLRKYSEGLEQAMKFLSAAKNGMVPLKTCLSTAKELLACVQSVVSILGNLGGDAFVQEHLKKLQEYEQILSESKKTLISRIESCEEFQIYKSVQKFFDSDRMQKFEKSLDSVSGEPFDEVLERELVNAFSTSFSEIDNIESFFSLLSTFEEASRVWNLLFKRSFASKQKPEDVGSKRADSKDGSKSRISSLISSIVCACVKHKRMIESFVNVVSALPRDADAKKRYEELKKALLERCKTLDSLRQNLLNFLKGEIDEIAKQLCEKPKTCAFVCSTLISECVGKFLSGENLKSVNTVCLIQGRLSEIESLLDEMQDLIDMLSKAVEKVMKFLRQLSMVQMKSQWSKISNLLNEKPPQYDKVRKAMESLKEFNSDGTIWSKLDTLSNDVHDVFLRFNHLSLLLAEHVTSLRREDDPRISDLNVGDVGSRLQQEIEGSAQTWAKDEISKMKNELIPMMNEVCNFNERITQTLNFAKDVMGQQLDNMLEEFEANLKQAKQQVTNDFFVEPNALSTAIQSAVSIVNAVTSFGPSERDVWKIRERTLYNILRISSSVRGNISAEDADNVAGARVLAELQKVVAERRALETKAGAKILFSCKTFFDDFQALISKGLETNAERIEKDLNDRLSNMNSLSEHLVTEKDHDKKQLAVLALRKEQAALTDVMGNVTDITQNFKVMATFVSQMRDHLVAIDAKLDALAGDVRAMRRDVQRLAGLPVVEVLEHYRRTLLAHGQKISEKVYVPLMCAQDRSAISKDPKSEKEYLLERVRQFLSNGGKSLNIADPKGVLLITGLAGGGKSVCAGRIEELILGKHYEDRAQKGKTVVLIWAHLPQLQRPITGLFEEALSLRYQLRNNQIHELRGLLQEPNSNYEAVFVLEAYDELRPEFRFKNLFKTNNLDLYRPVSEELQTNPGSSAQQVEVAKEATAERSEILKKAKRNPAFAEPKVIILCRKELLSNIQGYENSFVPIESLNEEKDEVHEALNYFEEVEIANFDDSNRLTYFQLHVAVRVRQAFQRHFFSIKPLPPDRPNKDELRLLKTYLTEIDEGNTSMDDGKSKIQQLCQLAASLSAPLAFAGTEIDWMAVAKFVVAQWQLLGDEAKKSDHCMFQLMALLLCATSPSPPELDLQERMAAFLKDIETQGLWTCEKMVRAFNEIRELKDITTTPFMVEIMVNVLPLLQDILPSPTSIKQELILLTSEEHAEMCWALLREQGMMTDQKLKAIQESLQEQEGTGSDSDERENDWSDKYSSDEDDDGQKSKTKRNKDKNDARAKQSRSDSEKKTGGDDERAKQSRSDSEKKTGGDDEHIVRATGETINQFKSDEVDKLLSAVAEKCASKVNKGNSDLDFPGAYLVVQLRRSLRRKPVRRSIVYHVFLDHLMRSKIDKARETSGSTMTYDQILREAMDYSCRLACKMTYDGLTQVAYVPRSQVFQSAVTDEWFTFFGVGDRHAADREAMREVSPLKQSGGIYSFLHKSIQEFLVAKILNDSLCRAVDESGMPKHDLLNLAMWSKSLDDLHAAPTPQTTKTGYRANRPTTESETVDKRRKRRVMHRLIESLASSPWQLIELDGEEAICDFLVDMQLDNTNSCTALQIAAALCSWNSNSNSKLQQLQLNIKALLNKPLPKRSGGTLLHAAADEGVHKVLELAQQYFHGTLTLRNNAGKTALAVAMSNQDLLACEKLVKARHSLLQDCESFPVKLSLQIKGQKLGYDVMSAEIAAIKRGKAFFEIKLDLQKLRVKPVYLMSNRSDENKPRFAGQICIGFAGGIAPKRQSLDEAYKLDINLRRLQKFENYLKKEYLPRVREFIKHKLNNKETEQERLITQTVSKIHENSNVQSVLRKYQEMDQIFNNEPNNKISGIETAAKVWNCIAIMSEDMKSTFIRDELNFAQNVQKKLDDKEEGGADDKKGGAKKQLKDVQKIYEDFVKQRLERCPIGNPAAPGSATYSKFHGIALLVTERFGTPGDLALYCKKVNLGGDIESSYEIDEDAFPAAMLVNLFESSEETKVSKPNADRDNERDNESKGSQPKPLALDVAKKQDKVTLTLAIEFLNDKEQAQIYCCWSQGENQGSLINIQSISIDEEAALFPALAFWNVSKKCLIQANFGNKPSAVKPPDGFKPLISVVPGRPALFVACVNRCWDFAKQILVQSYRKEADGTQIIGKRIEDEGSVEEETGESDICVRLAWVDTYTGDTVLHHFVKKDDSKAVENMINLCAQALQNKHELKNSAGNFQRVEMNKFLLSKNKDGFAAFCYVKSDGVAKLLLHTADAMGLTKALMVKDYIRYHQRNDARSDKESNFLREQLRQLDSANIEEVKSLMIEMAVEDGNIVKMLSYDHQDSENNVDSDLRKLRDAVFKTALWKEGKLFEFMDATQKGDIAFVQIAVQSDFMALCYATDSLKKNKESVLPLLRRRGMALEHVNKSLQQDRDIVLAAVSNNGEALSFAHTDLSCNREIVMSAVGCSGRALKFANDSMQNDADIVNTAVSKDPSALEFASIDRKNEVVLVKKAVSADGMTLLYASKSLRQDRAIVKIAVESDGLALQYASEKLRCDDDIVQAALKSNPMALLFAEQKTRRNWITILDLARRNPRALDFALGDYQSALSLLKKTPEELVPAISVEIWMDLLEWCSSDNDYKDFARRIYKAILQSDGTAIKQLPEHVQRDDELVELAFQSSKGRSLQHASEKLRRNKDLALRAVQMDAANLAFVDPKIGRDTYLEICQEALTRSPAALAYVDRKLLADDTFTGKLPLKAVLSENGMALEYVPESLRVYCEFALTAVSSNGKALRFVPLKVRRENPDIVEAAINKDGGALEFVNPKVHNYEDLAAKALDTCGLSLQFIPEEQRYKYIEKALQKDGRALEFLDLKTKEHVLVALTSSSLALTFVPSSLLNDKHVQALLPDIVKKHGALLRYIPADIDSDKYKKLADLAIKQDFAALEFAQCSFEDKELSDIIQSRERFSFDHWIGMNMPEFAANSDDVKATAGQGVLDFRSFTTVTCPNLTALRGKYLYYEVEILEIFPSSEVQFGFADHSFHPKDPEYEGVGDDSHSWAVDGLRHFAWHAGKNTKWSVISARSYDNPHEHEKGILTDDWKAGDVIGLACDPSNGLIAASVNGLYPSVDKNLGLRAAFRGLNFRGPGLYPALSGSAVRLRYNFGPLCGGGKFRCPPPPWVNMETWRLS